MDIGAFLQKLCVMLQDIFFASYGDPNESVFGDFSLPASSDWSQIASITNPCILYVRNLDAVDEVMITWDKDTSVGMRLPASAVMLLDCVSGVIYAKVSDPAATASINVGVISKRITE